MNARPRFAPFLAVLLAASIAQGATYEVDPSHTSVVFSISHLGYSFCYGMFRETSGTIEFDPQDPAACSFRFQIEVASIDTMNQQRDEHLLAPDFFDAKQFPQITFQSERVEKVMNEQGKEVYNATGQLKLHGTTREVTLPIQLLGSGPDPFGGTRIGFLCLTGVKRSDYGVGEAGSGLGDNVGVTISFEGLLK